MDVKLFKLAGLFNALSRGFHAQCPRQIGDRPDDRACSRARQQRLAPSSLPISSSNIAFLV